MKITEEENTALQEWAYQQELENRQLMEEYNTYLNEDPFYEKWIFV